MQRKIFILLGGLLVLASLCGCVSTLIAEKTTRAVSSAKPESFTFDLSAPGADAGKLIVQFRPPSNQMFADKYAIAVDSKTPLVVSKLSDVTINLDAGKHSVKFYTTSGSAGESGKVTFGKATLKELVIVKDKTQTLKYIGPYRLFGEGKVEAVQ